MTRGTVQITGINFQPEKSFKKSIINRAHFVRERYKVHTVDLSPIEIDGLLSEYFKDHRSITCARMQQVCGMTRSTAYRRLQTLTQGEHPSLQREGYKMPLPTYRLKGITDVPTPQIAGNESDRVKGGFCVSCKTNCYIIL